MREIYRKRGSIVRYENGTILRATEAGEAIEEDGLFRCRPWSGVQRLPHSDDAAVMRVARNIRSLATGSVTIERLIVTDGRAEHQFEDRAWSDENRRVHVAFTTGRHRLLIDEGAFEIGDVAAIVSDFARIGPEREPPTRLRLAPRVMAAITPYLPHEQTAGGIDGKGAFVHAATEQPWPNWYRPSYRVRPQRMPFHVTARCNVASVDHDLPLGIGILAPPAGLTVRVVCVDAEVVYPATIQITSIDAMTEPAARFPYGAGVRAGEAQVSAVPCPA